MSAGEPDPPAEVAGPPGPVEIRHSYRCDYVLYPADPDKECYCRTEAELAMRLTCGCLADDHCFCSER